MKQKIKAVIFDVGGVLFLAKNKKKSPNILSSFKETVLLLEGIDIDLKKSYNSIKGIYLLSSKGEFSKRKTLKLLSEKLGVSNEKIEKAFINVYKKNIVENKELYAHILKLKKRGYKMGILSNQFHLSKEVLILKKYYKNFDALGISCDDKLRKPCKEAFDLILKRLKVKPGESLFVDDQEKNTNAAKDFGLRTILFKNNENYFSQLKRLELT